ncbi:helix-turn-helix domain-containing protein [Paenibacillus sp. P26]|nr:helix-turn-helix domain-containing protein [Paenibacillus sp. P26]
MEDDIFESVYETILRRDTKYDGRYYVGIKSTGIFCRPSCRSRIPKPENVKVYGSIEEARQAGFRPCKRCRPDHPAPHGPDAEIARAVTELIERRYNENLTLGEMAAALNLSPFHLRRVFKRSTGATPAKQLLHTRLERSKRLLAEEDLPIAEIAAAVGFRSPSHFSYVFQKTVGAVRWNTGRKTGNERIHKKEECYMSNPAITEVYWDEWTHPLLGNRPLYAPPPTRAYAGSPGRTNRSMSCRAGWTSKFPARF